MSEPQSISRTEQGYLPVKPLREASMYISNSSRRHADRDPRRNEISPPISPLDPLSLRGQRQGSVSDRSPLQRLEGKLDGISKEERRARMEEAERRAMERKKEGGMATTMASQSRGAGGQPPSQPTYPRQSPSQATPLVDATRAAVGRRHVSAPETAEKGDARKAGRGSVDLSRGPFEPTSHQRSSSDGSQAFQASQKFRRASDALRMQNQGRTSADMDSGTYETTFPQSQASRNNSVDLQREGSKKYRYRARDAGFAGAAAAMYNGPGPGFGLDSTNRQGSRRQSIDQREQNPIPVASRGNSIRLQKKSSPQDISARSRDHDYISTNQQELHPDHINIERSTETAARHNDHNPLSPNLVAPASAHQHRSIGELFHNHHEQGRHYQRSPILEEWRAAGIARLMQSDLILNNPNNGQDGRRASWQSGSRNPGLGPYDGPYDEEAISFRPPLLLKCGPLLRYTGMRRERPATNSRSSSAEREIWRGSVMIVTLDSHSSYGSVPMLRLFAQPMDLLPPLPTNTNNASQDFPLEYDDPISGQVKVSRTGKPLFVKPVDQLEDGLDVSRVEDVSGLFETTPSPNVPAQHANRPDGQRQQPNSAPNRSRIRRYDGEKAGKYREVRAARLHTDRGVTFWRFNMEIELGSVQTRVAYRINQGPAIGFWVPARGESMNIMFHSCNGFSLSVNPNDFSGPDPLWRDVLNKHQTKPFHVMLGGGDQIYNDAAMRDTVVFKEWLNMKNPEHKHKAPFSESMQYELEGFYLNRYSMWFSQGLFGLANCQIPMVNVWDDHDIIDGYGSYPHHFMKTKVFTGLGAVAFKYYMLFQHQSVITETQREEPSWLIGATPGPYINELSRSIFMFLGRKVAFLGLDCRTERMRDEILSQESYDLIFDRCRREIVKGETKHLIVLLGVPIAYPRLNFLENILTSRIMDPIKAIGRTGVLGGFVNKFDGGVEILDDLDDHWTAKHHKAERNWFIQELQELAAEKSVRVTILGGDVHLGAVGQFYTKKKLGVSKDRDHRYMPNVISSAIVNTPPPNLMGDVLNKRNKIHHLDSETDEDMIPMFEEDVDGKQRNNLHLLPRRNYCSICEYVPGSTPPPTPRLQPKEDGLRGLQNPPGSIKRTLSLNNGSFRPTNLVRRLSGSRTRDPSASLGLERDRSYGPNGPEWRLRRSESGNTRAGEDQHGLYSPLGPAGDTRPSFFRRPTDLSEKMALKAAARGGPEGNVRGMEPGHIDLEGGLDISLNMEVSQRDPGGITRPYRLLVPALWYEGQGDPNTSRFKSRGASLMDRLRGRASKDRDSAEDYYSGSESDSRGPSLERESIQRSTRNWPNAAPIRRDINENRGMTNPAKPVTNYDGTNEIPFHDKHNNNDGHNVQQPSSRHHAAFLNRESEVAATTPAVTNLPQMPPSGDVSKQRRVPGGLFGFRRHGQPVENYYDDSGDDSLTESDFDSIDLEQQAQQHESSNTGRPFGGRDKKGVRVGNDTRDTADSRAYTQQQIGPNGLPYEDGKRKGWKIWK